MAVTERSSTPQSTAPPSGAAMPGRLLAGGLLLGVGLGGFVDGIVFHQLLQWHHLLTAEDRYAAYPKVTAADLEQNTVWDGVFHAGTWVATVVGLVLLWSVVAAGRRLPGRLVAGLALAGWGLFDLVEGVLLHQVLGLHHVRDDLGGPLGWDIAYLALGAGLLVAGGVLLRRSALRRGGGGTVPA